MEYRRFRGHRAAQNHILKVPANCMQLFLQFEFNASPSVPCVASVDVRGGSMKIVLRSICRESTKPEDCLKRRPSHEHCSWQRCTYIREEKIESGHPVHSTAFARRRILKRLGLLVARCEGAVIDDGGTLRARNRCGAHRAIAPWPFLKRLTSCHLSRYFGTDSRFS